MSMKMPSAWIQAGVAKKPAEPQAVNARIDMSAEVAGKGNCPECKEPMQVLIAGNAKVWACIHDRITLPIPDGHE